MAWMLLRSDFAFTAHGSSAAFLEAFSLLSSIWARKAVCEGKPSMAFSHDCGLTDKNRPPGLWSLRSVLHAKCFASLDTTRPVLSGTHPPPSSFARKTKGTAFKRAILKKGYVRWAALDSVSSSRADGCCMVFN